MSHEDEIRQQQKDDEEYQQWLERNRPTLLEEWCRKTDKLTAKVKASEGSDYAEAVGEINGY